MAYAHNPDMVVQALARMIQQFKGKIKFRDLLSIIGKQSQDVEDMWLAIALSKALANATGQQMDDIGALVGEKRSGRDDVDYKEGIELRIMINGSDGSIPDLNAIVAKADPAITFEIKPAFPAALDVSITSAVSPSFDPNPLATVIATSRLGGVGARLFFFASVPFQYDTAGGEYDVGLYAASVDA